MFCSYVSHHLGVVTSNHPPGDLEYKTFYFEIRWFEMLSFFFTGVWQ